LVAEHHIDPNALRACIERWCKERLTGPSEEELREREGTIVGSAQSTGPVGPTLSSEIIAAIQDIFRKYNG
jgi:hypothetical protein